MWGAPPKRIVAAHSTNQFPNVFRDNRPARLAMTNLLRHCFVLLVVRCGQPVEAGTKRPARRQNHVESNFLAAFGLEATYEAHRPAH